MDHVGACQPSQTAVYQAVIEGARLTVRDIPGSHGAPPRVEVRMALHAAAPLMAVAAVYAGEPDRTAALESLRFDHQIPADSSAGQRWRVSAEVGARALSETVFTAPKARPGGASVTLDLAMTPTLIGTATTVSIVTRSPGGDVSHSQDLSLGATQVTAPTIAAVRRAAMEKDGRTFCETKGWK